MLMLLARLGDGEVQRSGDEEKTPRLCLPLTSSQVDVSSELLTGL